MTINKHRQEYYEKRLLTATTLRLSLESIERSNQISIEELEEYELIHGNGRKNGKTVTHRKMMSYSIKKWMIEELLRQITSIEQTIRVEMQKDGLPRRVSRDDLDAEGALSHLQPLLLRNTEQSNAFSSAWHCLLGELNELSGNSLGGYLSYTIDRITMWSKDRSAIEMTDDNFGYVEIKREELF